MNSRIFMSLYILVVLFVFALGCAKTQEAGKPEPKGFISDVSMLQEDPEGKVTLVYINENVDFASYDKVWL